MLKKTLKLIVMITLTTASWAVSSPTSKLVNYFAKLEQLAQEQGEIAPQAYGRDRFPQEVARSQNLAESGKYGQAADVLSALLEQKMASDWRRMLTTRHEILKKWSQTGVIELTDYRRFYLDTGPRWFRKRIRPIITLWKLNGVNETEKYQLLRALFRNREDTEGELLVLEAIAASKNSSGQDAANALLQAGNQHNKAKQYDKARTIWLQVKEQFPNSPAWAEAVHNLGLLDKRKGDFAGAIRWFSVLLDAELNNIKSDRQSIRANNSYKAHAQWEIAHCLFAQKKYRDALKAYRLTETKYPFQSWHGNAHSKFKQDCAFYQGLCHEWLKDSPAAVRMYFKAAISFLGLNSDPVVHLRIVDIYEAGGRIKDLENLLDEVDREHLANVRRELGKSEELTDEEIMKHSPTRITRRILKLRKMEADKDWRSLVLLVKNHDSGFEPEPYEARAKRRNWEAFEAARILAKHARKTTPLLIARIKEIDDQIARVLAKANGDVPYSFRRGEIPDRGDVKWLYYALGLCGTKKAVATLESYALGESNSWWTSAVVYALSVAGKRGQAAITRLKKKAVENLKLSIEHYLQDRFPEPEREIRFPKLRKVRALPKTWDEFKIINPNNK